MDIRINDELRAYIDPLNPNEYEALERSLLAEGCRDALVLWGDVLIDGHNRYDICRKHGIEFRTVQNDRFASIEDVMLWMIDNQLARRSVSDFQRGMLALRKKAILTERVKAQQESAAQSAPAQAEEGAGQGEGQAAPPKSAKAPKPPVPLATREEVAKVAGISSNAISRIERIQKTATPELVEAVRAGTISLNAAAAVASLPSEQQVAAVNGGRKELQQAARQVREAKSPPKPRAPEASEPVDIPTDPDELRARFEALHAENVALRAKVVSLTIALKEARAARADD